MRKIRYPQPLFNETLRHRTDRVHRPIHLLLSLSRSLPAFLVLKSSPVQSVALLLRVLRIGVQPKSSNVSGLTSVNLNATNSQQSISNNLPLSLFLVPLLLC